MRSRAAAVAMLLGFALLVPRAAAQKNEAGLGLPPNARLLEKLYLPGKTHHLVVAYATKQTVLAVVAVGNRSPRIIWSKNIPAPPSTLKAPGPAGLFEALLPTGSSAQELIALRVNGNGSVASAIDKNGSGTIHATEGLSLQGLTFLARDPDTKHLGSVRYRLVRHYQWSLSSFRLLKTTRVPDYLSNQYPRPNGLVRTKHGDKILIRLELARTDAEKTTGLMNIKKLDPDTGMIFIWTDATHDSFWMENTYIPLTIAFLNGVGTIQEMMDMQPLTTNLHTPKDPYLYAIEVNQGFLVKNGIGVEDRVRLSLEL